MHNNYINSDRHPFVHTCRKTSVCHVNKYFDEPHSRMSASLAQTQNYSYDLFVCLASESNPHGCMSRRHFCNRVSFHSLRSFSPHTANYFQLGTQHSIDERLFANFVTKMTEILQIVTPGELTNVKRQIKMREDGNWSRVDWSLAETLNSGDIQLIQGRLMALDPKVLLWSLIYLLSHLYLLYHPFLLTHFCLDILAYHA